MNRLKHWIIMPWLGLLLLASLHTIGHLLFSADRALAWWGAALAMMPMLGFMGWIALSGHARTAETPWLQVIAAVAGGVLALMEFRPLPGFYALGLGTVGVLLYVFWYTPLGRGNNPRLLPGASLPDLQFHLPDGTVVESNSLSGQYRLLLFVRGNWCPLCVAQVRELAERYQALQQRGVDVIVITPQPHEHTRQLAERFDVPMLFCVDADNRIAGQLGIVHHYGVPLGVAGYGTDAVYPTLILTDAQGTVLYADVSENYRARPEPDLVMAILDQQRARA